MPVGSRQAMKRIFQNNTMQQNEVFAMHAEAAISNTPSPLP